VLAQGRADGVFTLDDLQLTSLAITNLITFTYTWYRRDGVLSAPQLAEHYVTLVLRMLGVPQG
jgi:hypothetical protein